MTPESLILLSAAMVAGGIGSVAGFGIGSILTPLLSVWMDGRLAVAVVAIPHFVGTAIRLTTIEGRVDRQVMWRFGLASAAGGLAGALLQTAVGGPRLMILLAALLLFVAASELSGLALRMRFTGVTAWIGGTLSGLLGGLVGNQGGIRSAALLGFGLSRDAFVATATMIALFVDAARLPVYIVVDGAQMWASRGVIATATTGVVIGTIAGARLLRRIPERRFRKVVAMVLAILGIVLLARAI